MSGMLHLHPEYLTQFTSQYGSENTVSYVASNILSTPRVFPNYGDFTEACVFRTYGRWWKESPEHFQLWEPYTHRSLVVDDFLELELEHMMYIKALILYEVYNPGALVRILVQNQSSSVKAERQWFTLWKADRNDLATMVLPKEPREFRPTLNLPNFPTKKIRLEFNHDKLDYYTELDAVEVIGETSADVDNLPDASYGDVDDDLLSSLSGLSLSNPDSVIVRQNLSSTSDNGYFDKLPNEVLCLILSYLSMADIARVMQVSHLFHEHACNGLLPSNQHINLKPYWHLIGQQAVSGFAERCRLVKSLGLSWCMPVLFESASPDIPAPITSLLGSTLLRLDLASCSVSGDVFADILTMCPNLEDLDIASTCDGDGLASKDIMLISQLKKLKRLNLYRSTVDDVGLMLISTECHDLEFVNLGSCAHIQDLDEVVEHMVINCPNIKGLDLWRNQTLTNHGIHAIANHCSNLLSLDVGWCKQVNQPFSNYLPAEPSALALLAQNCTKLKKLFLTANRSIRQEEMFAISKHCHDLEQLDLLGNGGVTPESVELLLDSCKNLKFLDISFCSRLTPQVHSTLKAKYPSCDIKRSFN